jgi:hypothetical protein
VLRPKPADLIEHEHLLPGTLMALSHVLLSMWVHPKWIDRVLSVKGRAQLSFKKQLG